MNKEFSLFSNDIRLKNRNYDSITTILNNIKNITHEYKVSPFLTTYTSSPNETSSLLPELSASSGISNNWPSVPNNWR